MYIENDMTSGFDVINYGTLITMGTSWDNTGKLTNYFNCNITQINNLVFSNIVQMYGTTSVSDGRFNAEIYGGYLVANSIDGHVDHYAGSFGKYNGNDVSVSKNYNQHSENATLVLNIVSDSIYDKFSAVTASFFPGIEFF